MGEPAKKPGRQPESYSPKEVPEIIGMAQAIAKGSALPSDSIADPFAGGDPPRTSNRILGCRRVQSWENYYLPSAIYSVAKLAGFDEDVLGMFEWDNKGTHFFSAITGDMFTPMYDSADTVPRDDGWATVRPTDSGFTACFFTPQAVKRAYAAFGRTCVYLSAEYIKENFRTVKNAVKASIDKGLPVLSWGWGLYDCSNGERINISEACYIGGYESDQLLVNGPKWEGDKLDKDGFFTFADGEEGLLGSSGLFFVGEPIEKTPLPEIYREAIAAIPEQLTLPTAGYISFGKAAFELWADTLLDETRYAGKTRDELLTWGIHCKSYCNVCTSQAVNFLRAAPRELESAAKILPLYEQIKKRKDKIWKLSGGFTPPAKKFRRRRFRAKIAGLLREMGDICGAIVECYRPKTMPEIVNLAAQQNRPASIEELRAFIAKNGEPPRSKKIKKLRRLWHDLKCENFYLEGCFAAAMKAAGDAPKARKKPPTEDTKKLPLAFEYLFMMAVSGTLFTQTYPSPTSSAGMSSELGHSIMPHMFRQLGWSYLYIDREMIAAQPALVMNAIKASVKRKIPVMSCGIGNVQLKERYFDPLPEWCLIGGYDKKSRLLVNVYPEDAVTDKHGYIAIENALPGSDGLYILEKKQQKMDMAQLYKEAFRAIPDLITMPAYHGVSFGQQAYYDWADAMLDDANFEDLPDDQFEGFLWRGYMAPWIVAETNECYIRRFFDQVIAECSLPEAVRVKEIYTKIHADLLRMQELHGGDFDADREVISKSGVRQELAGILRHMGDLHNELFELFA